MRVTTGATQAQQQETQKADRIRENTLVLVPLLEHSIAIKREFITKARPRVPLQVEGKTTLTDSTTTPLAFAVLLVLVVLP